MSIVTKTGDLGHTGLMYNRRVAKCHPRVEAYGAVDELNAALGLARSGAGGPGETLARIQSDLVLLMGELATAVEDLPRYRRDGFQLLGPEATNRLEKTIAELETSQGSFQGWATPGANSLAAHLDLARTICRRAERRVCSLHDSEQPQNPQVIIFLNRLGDLLWLMARAAER